MTNELRTLNPRNPKRKWNDRSMPSDNIASKKPTVCWAKSHVPGRPKLVGNLVGLIIVHQSAVRVQISVCGVAAPEIGSPPAQNV